MSKREYLELQDAQYEAALRMERAIAATTKARDTVRECVAEQADAEMAYQRAASAAQQFQRESVRVAIFGDVKATEVIGRAAQEEQPA